MLETDLEGSESREGLPPLEEREDLLDGMVGRQRQGLDDKGSLGQNRQRRRRRRRRIRKERAWC